MKLKTDISNAGFSYATNLPLVSSLRIFVHRILEMLHLDRVNLVWEWNGSEKFKETKTVSIVHVLRFSLLLYLLYFSMQELLQTWNGDLRLHNFFCRIPPCWEELSLWRVSVFPGDSEPSQWPSHLGHQELIGTTVHSLTNSLHDGMSALKYMVPTALFAILLPELGQHWVYWQRNCSSSYCSPPFYFPHSVEIPPRVLLLETLT
jgi:hypothetical protein